jgi:glutathione S-transferase
MPMKLYANPDNYKTSKILIAAKFAGLEVETAPGAENADKTGKMPVLETDRGCIFTSNAIARYISRTNRIVGLYGQNLIAGGMIDSWMEFCTNELEVPLMTWVLPVMGVIREVPEATKCAKEDVKKALTVLNNHLLQNTYMVGHGFTLADISISCALVDGMRLVIDEPMRKQYPNLMRWFNLCTIQPEFVSILGKVSLLTGSSSAAAAASPKEAAPKKEAKAKKEAAPKKEAASPKAAAAPASPKQEGKKGKKDKKTEEKPADAGKKDAEDPEAARKALLKKVTKEGGKRGVEIEGAADMGGLQFFCTSVEFPDGDLEMLRKSVEAMNEKSDPTEEERKGGSGAIGKMVFSAGTQQLGVLAYVPTEKLGGDLVTAEWLKAVLATFGGEVTEIGDSYCAGFVKADGDKNIFPLKIREPMILEANNYLRKRGLFPEDDGDSDEMVFGDDDFPSM